ncbi:MAG: hypothetical protein ABSB89_04745 [Candidatus Bathyarchaeia archaeon]
MKLNFGKFLLLSVLLFLAIFAVTMISTASHATRALGSDSAGHSHNGNSPTLTFVDDPVNGTNPNGGDPVGGGGFP